MIFIYLKNGMLFPESNLEFFIEGLKVILYNFLYEKTNKESG